MKLLLALIALLVGGRSLAADAGQWATVNGHRLYFERWGHGPPLLLLHGGGNSIAGSFSHQRETLAADHEVIGVEQVGQGHSPDVPGPLTYGGMAEDTAALLSALKLEHIDVVGWSDGGIIGLILAVRHPALVRRLAVSGANVDPLSSDPASARELAHAKPGATVMGEKLRLLWLNSPTPDELTFAALHGVTIRVLVMSGDHDAIPLDQTLKIFRALPQAQLWVLPGTGHGTFNQRPEWVNPMLVAFFAAP